MSRGTWERTPGRGLSFAYGAITLYGWPFQTIRLPRPFVTPRGVRSLLQVRPATPGGQRLRAFAPTRFGLFPVRSPLLGESRLISFPPPTEMFQFGGYRLRPKGRMTGYQPAGFPHSGIPGSSAVCASPGLFAAYHALRRLLAPRHPPCALSTSAYLLPQFWFPYSAVKDRLSRAFSP